MCIFGGGGGEAATPAAPPVPTPLPNPVPTDVNPIKTADSQRKQLDAMKYGALSTVKTSPAGVTGEGPDLQNNAANAMFPAQKKTLGS